MSQFDPITQDEHLQLSATRDVWGFTYPVKQAIGQTLLRASVPAWMARAWTVNINGMKWSADQAGLVASTPNFQVGPDQQVASYATLVNDYNTGQQNVPSLPYRLRVAWGVGGATEIAYVDYPATGGAFQLMASDILISLEPLLPPFASLPIIGGSLCPSAKCPSDGQFKSCPTLTVEPGFVAFGTSIVIGIPKRARAYRFYKDTNLDTGIVGEWPRSEQQANGGAIVSTDSSGNALGPNSIGIMRSTWVFPIDPRATQLFITNNSGTTAYSWTFEFLLDLGG